MVPNINIPGSSHTCGGTVVKQNVDIEYTNINLHSTVLFVYREQDILIWGGFLVRHNVTLQV